MLSHLVWPRDQIVDDRRVREGSTVVGTPGGGCGDSDNDIVSIIMTDLTMSSWKRC